jgi:hypothetical protein
VRPDVDDLCARRRASVRGRDRELDRVITIRRVGVRGRGRGRSRTVAEIPGPRLDADLTWVVRLVDELNGVEDGWIAWVVEEVGYGIRRDVEAEIDGAT